MVQVISDVKYPFCMNSLRCFFEDLELLINDNNIQGIYSHVNKMDNEYYGDNYNIIIKMNEINEIKNIVDCNKDCITLIENLKVFLMFIEN
jgi:hypothetical protein